ncbi:neural cell adhesion molecule 2-like isoform X2 [Ylistrum balloti]|uniref:neural cell adhesion molecule 2-like isoform X2 n=1 Tax=Ylistrum balloti TaxID=509963 RepID=UPI002905F096|nr:neural cell adhesion molecule 2-like isoform X2 [Ylistrum balloti]
MDNFTCIFLIQGFLLLFVSNCYSQDIFIDGNPNRQVQGTENALFKCEASVTDNKDPELKWFNPSNEQILDDGSNKHMRLIPTASSNTLTAQLENITESMAGVYRCEGVFGPDSVKKEATVTLTVSAPIITTGIEKYQAFTQGQDAVVRCSSNSNGFETSWYRKYDATVELPISKDDPKMIQTDEGLLIKNITTDDGGTYICMILSSITFKKVPITVFVKVPPVITQSPSRQETITGTSMRMECRATGIPEPKYEWFKIGQTNALVDGDRFSIDAVVGTFIINEVIIDDKGIYRCEAYNDAGRAMNEAELNVLIPPSIRELNNMSANEGTSVTLRCVVNGDPIKSITWEKGGVSFSTGNQDVEGNSGDLVSVKTNVRETDMAEENQRMSELTINNLLPEDAGMYECHADGGKSGTAEGQSILTVRYAPVFAKDQKEHNYTWAGQTGVLRCITKGEPLPTIEWFRNDVKILQGQSYFDQTDRQVDAVTREGVLMIRVDFGNENEVYTTYTCQATNDMGVSQKNITLVKSSVPVLNKVSELELTPTTVRFSVEVASVTNGPPPTSVLVEYGTGNITEVNLDRNGPTIVEIEKLQVNTPYTFQFFAKSEAGRSVSETVQLTTLAMREPYPTEVMSKPESDESTRYLLQWSPPKTGGSPILNYNVRYRMVSVKDEKSVENKYQFEEELRGWYTVKPAPAGGSSTLRLDGLVHSTFYQVEVTATNLKGTSEPRPFIFRTANHESGSNPDEMTQLALEEDIGLPIGIIILIVVVVFIVLFVIVDVTCYFRNKCGVIMCLKERVGHAGSADTRSKEPIMESGESEKGTLPIGGVQNKDGHLVEDEKKVPLLDSEGGAKDEVEEENEIAAKEAEEMEPEDKQPDAADTKPVAEGEEAKDDPAPTPEVTADPVPPPQVATTPPASDGPAELPVATEPSA